MNGHITHQKRGASSISSLIGSGFRRFFSGLMFSRVTGAARDIAMASYFGDHASVALFFVAFRAAMLLRRFFGEGPLGSAFMPHYLGVMKHSRADADDFFFDLLAKLAFLTLVITVLCLTGLHLFSVTLSFSSRALEIADLFKQMLPIMVLIALYGLTIALHQTHHRFFCSQVSAALTNVMWLIGIFVTRHLPISEALHTLTHFIVAGFAMTCLLSFITMPKESLKGLFRVRLKTLFSFSPQIKSVFHAFILGIVGVGAVQINIFLDSLFALYASSQGPVFLWYAQRFYQLAFASFSLAFTSSIIPVMTKALKEGNKERARAFFSKGSARVLTATLAASGALIAMASGLTEVFFGRGAFGFSAVASTAHCLRFYSIGLLPAALIPILASLFYAFNDFKTPMKCSLYAIGVHLISNTLAVLVFGLGPASIALSTTVSASYNLFLLYRSADKELIDFELTYLRSTLVVVALTSVCVWGEGLFLQYLALSKYACLGIQVMSFALLFYAQGVLVGNGHILALFKTLLPSWFRIKRRRDDPSTQTLLTRIEDD